MLVYALRAAIWQVQCKTIYTVCLVTYLQWTGEAELLVTVIPAAAGSLRTRGGRPGDQEPGS